MADSPTTRTDTPPPPPPKPPEQGPAPDVQQKMDTLRAQREGNTTPHDQGGVKPSDRTPSRGLEPTPDFQQKLDAFRAHKEAKQDAGQYVDHRAEKAQNTAARHADRPTAGHQRAAEGHVAPRTAEASKATPAREAVAGERPGAPNIERFQPPPRGPGGEAGDRRLHQAQHLKPEADLRGQAPQIRAAEKNPGERPQGAHYRDPGQDQPRADRSEVQRQGLRDAVADAKSRRLENAVGFDQATGRPGEQTGGRPEPIVVIGGDQLFKSDYLDAVRRRAENHEKAEYRMDPADVVDADSLTVEQIDAMKAQGARIVDLGDGDPDVVDPWVKSRTDEQRDRASAPLTPDSGDGGSGRYEHYQPLFEKYPEPGSRIMTGDMQEARVIPAAAEMGPDVHTFDAFPDEDHKPNQLAQNIGWTGKIALDNAGHPGPDGVWRPDTYTIGYSEEARNGNGPGDFSTMEDEVHRDLGAWRQGVDRGDNAVFPDPYLPPDGR
ncbi:hypothetical protein Aab01nite_27450 [Paractinoplanes abujensis]|uniref:Uncharacterized protein n=1 Tax=Paractinoplanes abujensis TaxID=882441 RepID=A0A7W7D2Y9_9ACTN|nr:hypothetical protein [Actinoplanes abujensis]MBB4698360.1 hypothetical protein [Actinoplanes abujensis]GID19155.1 hypothetical protein Aab01nite_27450 [Actinoplanes abujensis]